MSRKSSTVAFRPSTPTSSTVRANVDRRPTEAEREYVRARAREAARGIFEAEQRQRTAPPDEVNS